MDSHLIDCHVLRYTVGERTDWLQQCVKSLEGHPINVHHMPGIPGEYIRARCRALRVGNAPFVSFVDPDDRVLPGAFDRCLKALADPARVMAWTGSLTVFEDQPLSMARVLRTDRHHQLIVVRRWAIMRALEDGDAGDAELWARIEHLGIIDHLPEPGYIWRDHLMTPQQQKARREGAQKGPPKAATIERRANLMAEFARAAER